MNRGERRAAKAQGKWIPLERATLVARTEEQIQTMITHCRAIHPDLGEPAIREIIERSAREAGEVWKNDRYQAHVIRWEPLNINGRTAPVVQLSIRRLDRGAARDWRDFQRIKNQLVGPECEAVELYPAESRLVDTATQFHLWCVVDPLFRFPFGYTTRVVTSESGGGSVQRALDDDATS
jgi:hypothetical protein